MSDIKDPNSENEDPFYDDGDFDDASEENFDFDDDDYYDELDDQGDFDVASMDEPADAQDGWDDADLLGAEKKSKFSLSFNTIVIIGAVIVGGIIMLSQFNKQGAEKTAETSKEKFTTALKMQGAFEGPGKIEEEKIQSVELKEEQKEKGFLFDADNKDQEKEEATESGPPMPLPIIVEQNIDDTTLQGVPRSPFDDVADQEIVVPESDVADALMDKMDVVDKKADPFGDVEAQDMLDAKVKDAEVKEVAVEKEPEVPVAPVKEAKVESAESDLDLQKEKELLESVAAKIKNDPKNIDLAMISSQLDSVTARLNSVEAKIDEAKMSSEKPAIMKAAPKVSKPKANSQRKSSVAKKTVRKSKPRASRATWELRAAQPGKAWVSKKGSRDMQPIIVGDTLAGIGRIQNISYQNNRWIVQGANGSIKQ